jgi:hypothetical protein
MKENWVVNLDLPRCDNVPKADVDLNGSACSVNDGISLDTNPSIFEVFTESQLR